jgi:Na+/H+-dicarboxylate symporter
MTVVPLVVSLLVTSVATFSDIRSVGRLGSRAVALFVALLAGVALFGAVAAPLVFARLTIDPAAAAALRAHAHFDVGATQLPTLRDFVVGLVPTNPVRAAADGALLPLIAFTLLFAAATVALPGEARALLTAFFRAVSQAMLIIVGWILRLTPVGVFALAVGMGADLGLAAFGALGYYVVGASVLMLGAALALYPVVAVTSGVSWRAFARACARVQAVAAGTRSSLASLPALIEGATRLVGDRPGITGFVLPLAVATFKAVTPITNLAGAFFIAQLYGVHLSVAQVATVAAVSVALSFSSPGIPSGGLLVVTAPVMMSAGLPLDGIGLLIAADAIPDVCRTVMNVTADMAAATILAPRTPLAPVSAPAGVLGPAAADAR